jgi:hypothetical protein
MLLPIRPFTRKSPEKINNSDNARVIRITEIYLTNSEANLRGNTTIGATPLAAINKLRTRTGLRALGSVFFDQILNEIRKELAFEGHRKMNLLRNSLTCAEQSCLIWLNLLQVLTRFYFLYH